jgi:alkaline phosphatase D
MGILKLSLVCILATAGIATAEVYFANGMKIGEVDQDSAILWTRLTRTADLNRDGAKFVQIKKNKRKAKPPMADQLPAGKTLDQMEGAVPGAPGEVRISWTSTGGKPISNGWKPVDRSKDFTVQLKLENLLAAAEYEVMIESRDAEGQAGQTLCGKFRTAPAAEQEVPVTFLVVTGQDYQRRDTPDGYKIYPHMLALDPDFFVHTGDIEYYDRPDPYATCLALARFKWNRVYGLPNLNRFHCNVASYFMKDDHDTTQNDAWPEKAYGNLTWQQGLDTFREQFPVLRNNYRTIRWGRDLQIWLVEGRDFRSPNTMPDGPEKTIWGKEQKDWFFRTVKESDATFRVLISPTPVVGPDRGNKNDNHANIGFKHEGDEIRQFIASQKNMFVVCGDRHWQYVSVDGETGVKEFSCGPTSDKHAGGWSNDNLLPEHRYLNVQGGFLSLTVDRPAADPVLTARYYSVDGELCHEDVNLLKQ